MQRLSSVFLDRYKCSSQYRFCVYFSREIVVNPNADSSDISNLDLQNVDSDSFEADFMMMNSSFGDLNIFGQDNE